MAKVKTLSGRAVRGLREFDLALGGRSLLLLGENGCGKSSLVNAIEYLFTGRIRHLTGTQGISLERHGHHQAFTASDLRVTARFDPGDVAVSRDSTGLSDIPTNLAAEWDVAALGQFVLRRRELLDFIHADAGDRFRTIAALIGIDSLDPIEMSMIRLRDELAGAAEEAQRAANAVEREFARVSPGASDERAALKGLNREATELGLTLATSIDDLERTTPAWLKDVRDSDADRTSGLSRVKNAAELAVVPGELEGEVDSLRRLHEDLAKEKESLARLSELSVLREGARYFDLGPVESCPLCEQSIDSEATLAQIRVREAQLEALSAEAKQHREACEALANAVLRLAARIGALADSMKGTPLADEVMRLTPLEERLHDYARKVRGLVDFKSGWPGPIPENDSLTALIDEIGKRVSDQLAHSGTTERDKGVIDLASRAMRLNTLSKDLVRNNQHQSDAIENHRRASQMCDAFSNAKKGEVRRVYQLIEKDVWSFYKLVHPDESIEEFQLVVDEARRASTQLRLKGVGGVLADPRALASEGHLDSLGLCIFLAFARHFHGEWKFLALDDVIMSIDAQHRSRIAKLLLQEFGDWQLVITTHDRIWFQEFIDHEKAYGKQGRYLNEEIVSWSFSEGAIFRAHRTRWERVAEALTSNNRESAANGGRQYLEWVLEEIVRRCGAKVELKPRYTTADLLQPAMGRLKELVPSEQAAIDGLFAEIQAASLPANFLSHENDLAPAVSIDEVRRFCESAHALYEWFTCTGCGRLMTYVRDTQETRCSSPACPAPVIKRRRAGA